MNLAWSCLLHLLLMLGLPPLLVGIIGRVKAFVAGRRGAPLLLPYRDILRLLRKGAVYSTTTTWIFRAGPLVTLAATIVAGCLLPLGTTHAPLAFEGDLVLFAYLFGLGRFMTMAAALDTGSSFEGMGASREALVGALAEPAIFLVLATLVVATQHLSLMTIFASLSTSGAGSPALLLAAAALGAALMAENARIPIDDPATHLELTMLHEVMVLDNSGPDLALIEYGSAVKLFVTAALFVGILVPSALLHPLGLALGVSAVAVGIGLVESVMARLRLPRVKQFLIGATALAAVALAAQLFAPGAV
jgi:formate hydrogenlyase subunit 4